LIKDEKIARGEEEEGRRGGGGERGEGERREGGEGGEVISRPDNPITTLPLLAMASCILLFKKFTPVTTNSSSFFAVFVSTLLSIYLCSIKIIKIIKRINIDMYCASQYTTK
jgi:hypothetical protein